MSKRSKQWVLAFLLGVLTTVFLQSYYFTMKQASDAYLETQAIEGFLNQVTHVR